MYTFLILAATLFAFQTNALVAALFLFSFTLLEKGKSFWAIVLILFSGFIKVYGIFQLGLLLCYPRFWRNMLYVIPTCLFFLLIPALNGKIGNLLSYYHTWIDVIMGHGENRLWHTFFYMQPWQNISHWSVWIQTGTLAVLAAMFIACYKKFGSFSFRVQVTGILMTWIVLFSNAADTHTYLISMAGYMLWYHSREQHETTDRILYFALLIVVMVVQIDVLCPTTIKHFLYRKLSLHLWLVFINLLRMCRITFVKSIADEYFSAMTIVRK